MKAIIDVSPKGGLLNSLLKTARQVDSGKAARGNYHLSFESSKLLLSELSTARIALLEDLRKVGEQSIYALAKLVGRNYSNVHSDINKLIELGLVLRTEDTKKVFVPFDSVEIRLTLSEASH
ncbi:hypothetical protein NQT62_08645 [Limnobacter humi]|uniref:Transcriptional regulator n=1 Tax=Limnobacter humi TaxID=1778671 RepID=A0ABT1WI00_9BURK|nr:hypothetical protein [Limnobacter humi]MCQ8896498.1 hypothetical protein [Limnobacter humi]